MFSLGMNGWMLWTSYDMHFPSVAYIWKDRWTSCHTNHRTNLPLFWAPFFSCFSEFSMWNSVCVRAHTGLGAPFPCMGAPLPCMGISRLDMCWLFVNKMSSVPYRGMSRVGNGRNNHSRITGLLGLPSRPLLFLIVMVCYKILMLWPRSLLKSMVGYRYNLGWLSWV